MKKWLMLALILLVVMAALFFLLPSENKVSVAVTVPAAQASVYRNLTDPQRVLQWLPALPSEKTEVVQNRVLYTTSSFVYSLQPGMGNVVHAQLQQGAWRMPGVINIIALQDSSTLDWELTIPSSSGPFQKIRQYFTARKARQGMEQVLGRLKTFLSKKENIYGLSIQATTVTDTLLATTQTTTAGYPQPENYYQLVDQLRKWIAAQGARETNYPMLHVNRIAANSFSLMVGIPINQRIRGNNDIFIKRMIPGNLLMAEVKGGPATIETGFLQFEHFITEQRMSSPAISYQQLVTNRMQVKDTAHWITRLCFPVY